MRQLHKQTLKHHRTSKTEASVRRRNLPKEFRDLAGLVKFANLGHPRLLEEVQLDQECIDQARHEMYEAESEGQLDQALEDRLDDEQWQAEHHMQWVLDSLWQEVRAAFPHPNNQKAVIIPAPGRAPEQSPSFVDPLTFLEAAVAVHESLHLLVEMAGKPEKEFILPQSQDAAPHLIIRNGVALVVSDLFHDVLLPAFIGRDIGRCLAVCPVCRQLFIRRRVGQRLQRCCGRKHSHTLRMRELRAAAHKKVKLKRKPPAEEQRQRYEENRKRYKSMKFSAKERIQLAASLRRSEAHKGMKGEFK